MLQSLWNRVRGGRASASVPAAKRHPFVRPEVQLLENRCLPSVAKGDVLPTLIDPFALTPVKMKLNAKADASKGASIATSETDYFTFVVPVTQQYTISATTPLTKVDTILGVYAFDGSLLSENDDITPVTNTDSSIQIVLNAGERVYLSVTNIFGTPRGGYKVTVNGAVGDDNLELPTGVNDTRSKPTELGVLGGTQSFNALVLADGADWFRFTIGSDNGENDRIRINYDVTEGNLNLALYNAGGKLLENAKTKTSSETISLQDLIPGTYFLKVYGQDGVRNPHYRMNIEFGVIPPPPPPKPGDFDMELIFSGSFTPSQIAIIRQAEARIEEIIFGDLPDVEYNGVIIDDIRLTVRAYAFTNANPPPIFDGPGGVLAQAVDVVRRDDATMLPFRGNLEFDTADLAQQEASGELFGTALHEMLHALGFGTLWTDRNLVQDIDPSPLVDDPRFMGVQATAEFNARFGTNAVGVPLEIGDEAHWDELTLDDELMTPFVNTALDPLSRITVAAMADLGYVVDISKADPY